jgi:hypothetical protein
VSEPIINYCDDCGEPLDHGWALCDECALENWRAEKDATDL